jgi:thioredoxin-like negative regulator of GroEL
MKSGGMFRLAKVNSDNERAIAETLRVQGLPTVFAVSQGKFTDRFVGMLPQEQLQQFLVRTITGYGDRVQKNEVTDSMMDDATKDISQLAGLATLDFKKREKLRSLIDSALALPGGADEVGNLSNGAKVSIKYITNAGKDIRNPKFR